jgi:hypothetical protein
MAACSHIFDTEEARTEDGVWMSCSLCGQRADALTPLPPSSKTAASKTPVPMRRKG